jgi:hypothetical protein
LLTNETKYYFFATLATFEMNIVFEIDMRKFENITTKATSIVKIFYCFIFVNPIEYQTNNAVDSNDSQANDYAHFLTPLFFSLCYYYSIVGGKC